MANQYREHPSPTGRWVNDGLTPVPDAVAADTVVWVALTGEEGADQFWEGLAAQRITPDSVRLKAVPLFAYNLNYDDEVSVVPSAEGSLVVTAGLRESGNYTFRVWLDDHYLAELPHLVTEFGRLDCLIEGYSERLLGLSCDPEQAQVVELALRAGETEGRFVYERGRR